MKKIYQVVQLPAESGSITLDPFLEMADTIVVTIIGQRWLSRASLTCILEEPQADGNATVAATQ